MQRYTLTPPHSHTRSTSPSPSVFNDYITPMLMKFHPPSLLINKALWQAPGSRPESGEHCNNTLLSIICFRAKYLHCKGVTLMWAWEGGIAVPPHLHSWHPESGALGAWRIEWDHRGKPLDGWVRGTGEGGGRLHLGLMKFNRL